ncbi:BTB/POZ domain-containing protein At1g63850-like [Selaginella moellendorffii]|uniref:BTB/POZ domain-containing protein At1g63850-like n=1 Tax=Selaginella moellendorffii TaxID=88036 RepID=UPI000D1CB6E6|nr:BTB/POZ domain-containing protein At1g63850-like [Selaginella moellendorffii]XP_024524395.1 BTB/POZ domain-containing protein At1g63850-like [Selaginella moellendorffii]|eukprot:XP_024524394.1 BTB/POZ domain-containing protein At1g63850-like [Selaginella moellendorffii]
MSSARDQQQQQQQNSTGGSNCCSSRYGYGDVSSADVHLELVPISGNSLPLHLHSHVLRRSEYFEARLSERWNNVSAGRPIELCLDKCKDPSAYVRCFEVLYVPDRLKLSAFADVQDALTVLEVAAELLLHECVAACMKYLEAVPWTPDAEEAIRSCVSSLHLRPSPDLAARLCTLGSMPDCKPVDVMKEVLGELLSLVSNGAPPKARDITERVLLANVQAPASSAFAAVNEVALFKEVQTNLEALKIQLNKFVNFFSWNSHQVNVACSALRWLLEELFSLQIAETAIKMLAEEEDLAQLMVSRIYQNPFTETLFCILVRIFQALQKGEVVVARNLRLALVTTWLPVIAKLVHDADDSMGKDNELQRSLEEGLSAVVATLPLVDQEAVFKIWIGSCLKSRKAFPDLSDAFESWCCKLRQAQLDKEHDGGGPTMAASTPSKGESFATTLEEAH